MSLLLNNKTQYIASNIYIVLGVFKSHGDDFNDTGSCPEMAEEGVATLTSTVQGFEKNKGRITPARSDSERFSVKK